ncbi:MAG: Xaa-Pro aminopeptidase [Planctomycetota bacterium]|jgi:Xaa-Pro aminopeptidase
MYKSHRERLLKTLADSKTAAIIPTANMQTRNHDCEFRFRPTSDFWYLTGFAEPGSVLILLPQGIADGEEGSGEVRSILFLRDRDPKMETWNGRRLGIERAPDTLDIDEARSIDDLWEDLPGLLKGYERIMYRTGGDDARDLKVMELHRKLRGRARAGVMPPLELVDTGVILHEQRLFKTEAEINVMRKAAAMTAEAHKQAMALCGPGKNECEIEALIEYTFRRKGSTGPAYTSIVAGGNNACILHYIENNTVMNDGELLLIDAGAESEFYASDVTRTFPINGKFNDEQRAIYEVVLEAQLASIALAKPGVPHTSIHEASLKVLVRGMLKLGLLKGTEESVMEDESYRRFYMHGTSHWMGLDVHDCGAYTIEGKSRLLEPGMVFTVEPGLYIEADDETVEARWRGIGVRIEDDILITKDGHENLSKDIPKTVEDVEAACQARALEAAL